MRIYFASDLHLGAPYIADRVEHERRIVRWLDSIEADVDELYLLGDVFDYWFEYNTVVPRGYVRFLSRLARLTDRGVKVHIFTGNHDTWMFSYLPNEIGAIVHHDPLEVTLGEKRFLLGHGDDLGKDRLYSFMMWCFRNPVLQWIYKCLHPDIAGWIATTWSHTSRMGHYAAEKKGKEEHALEDELQVRYAKEQIAKGRKVDYLVFGHRHKVIECEVGPEGQRLLVIGDWIRNFSYAVFDGKELKMCKFNG